MDGERSRMMDGGRQQWWWVAQGDNFGWLVEDRWAREMNGFK